MKTIRFILMLSIIGMTACHNIEEQVLTQNQKQTGEELCGINNTEPNNITTTQIEEFEQYLSLQPDMYQVMFI